MRSTLKNNNFLVRSLSALVLFPMVIFMLFAGGVYAGALIVLALGLTLYEWNKLCQQANFSILKKRVWFALGNLYILSACYAFWRFEPIIQIYFVCIASIADIGAYLIGRWLKGPKLAPKISPNKTWSGALGGVFFIFLFTFLLSKYCLGLHECNVKPLLPPDYLLYTSGALFGIVAPAGDLLESWCKRKFGVKDSGRLVPGHGGVLDRIDSLLAISLTGGIFLYLFHHN